MSRVPSDASFRGLYICVIPSSMRTTIHFYFSVSLSLVSFHHTLSARSRQSGYRPHGATQNGEDRGRRRLEEQQRRSPADDAALVLHLAQIGRPRPVLHSDALGPVIPSLPPARPFPRAGPALLGGGHGHDQSRCGAQPRINGSACDRPSTSTPCHDAPQQLQ